MRPALCLLGVLLLSGPMLSGCGGNNADDFVDTSFVFARGINSMVDSPLQTFRVGPVLLVSDLGYGESTGFLPFATFDNQVEVDGRLPDFSTFPIDVIEGVNFKTNFEYTMITGGFVDSPDSFVIEQPRRRRPIRDIYVQFAHAATFQGELEFFLTAPDDDLTGATPAATLGFSGHTDSEQIPEGEYKLRIRRVSDGELIYDSGPLQFFRDEGADEDRGGHEWFFCILDNDQTTEWPVKSLLTDGFINLALSGEGATSALRARHVAHGVGPVDVLIDGDAGQPLASGLDFSQSSDFRALTPEEYVLSVTTPGQPTDVLLDQTVMTSPGVEHSFYVVDPGSGPAGVLGSADRRSVVTEARLSILIGAPEDRLVSVYLGDPEDVDPGAGRYGGLVINRAAPPVIFGRFVRNPGITVVTATAVETDALPDEEGEVIFGPTEIDLAAGDVRTLGLIIPASGNAGTLEGLLLDDL